MSIAPLTPNTIASRLQVSDGERAEAGFDSRATFLFALAVTLFVASRLWRITSYGLFGDELFSLWAARQHWGGLFAGVINDIDHPPLFYLLLKGWIMLGGESVLWLKLLPVSFSILAIIPFVLLCRELKARPAATNLAIALMGVNAYLVLYSQELRMYSLLLFFTTSSLWLFARFVNNSHSARKTQLALFASNLLLVYTHYFGWLVVSVEVVFLLLWARDRLLSFGLTLFALLLCFSPWAYLVTQAAIDKGGLGFPKSPPGLLDLVWFHESLNGPVSYRWQAYMKFSTALVIGAPVLALLFDGPVVWWGWKALKKRERKASGQRTAFWLLLLFSFLPLAIVFCASHLLAQAAWATRYLIIAAPSYMLLLAIAATSLQPKRVGIAVAVIMVGWATLSGFIELNNREKIAWEPLVRRMIESEPSQGGVTRIYTSDYNVISTLDYYLGEYDETRFEVKFTNDLTAPAESRYWVAVLKYRNDTHPLPQTIMAEKGFAVGDGMKVETMGPKAYLLLVERKAITE